jgi:penicillin-binding protein 1C
MIERRLRLRHVVIVLLAMPVLLGLATWLDLEPLPRVLVPDPKGIKSVQFLDRNNEPLNVTYSNRWNYGSYVSLYDAPPLLVKAFLAAEDKRFYQHGGVDWYARMNAMAQNLRARRIVRGASTITEQVVRMLHPRPRTFWSRWLEGWEAMRLERRFSKAAILEFYLNQVPYARQRRGVVQAAQYYFNRELDTLNAKEMLALAVLVRAPGRMDLVHDSNAINRPLTRLADRLHAQHVLDRIQYRHIPSQELQLVRPGLPADASHFVTYLKSRSDLPVNHNGRIRTTLDASLQRRVRQVLENRLRALRSRGVSDGAALVVDHLNHEVLAWVNAGAFDAETRGSQIDAVTLPRQPGSTLKPLLYALAIEKGWTAATLIDDSPLARPVAGGLHTFHNYSRQHYGPIRLRAALGNSLNIPAIRAVAYVGRDRFLKRLKRLGFSSLTRHPDYYGDGIGLGNGEVSLYELVQAYAVLANAGRRIAPRLLMNTVEQPRTRQTVYAPEVTSIIADILSDPNARQLEFGQGNLLRFPIQTAVKTGTSSDYRDAWAVGFSHRFTVGVWMGNLDQQPMQEVTGSVGPGLVLRSVFAELNRFSASRPLFLSRHLRAVKICPVSGLLAKRDGPQMTEWFRPGHAPTKRCAGHDRPGDIVQAKTRPNDSNPIEFKQPTPGLQIATDPRIPDGDEVFPFELAEGVRPVRTDWILNGELIGSTEAGDSYHWRVRRGDYTLQARLWQSQTDQSPLLSRSVSFHVK